MRNWVTEKLFPVVWLLLAAVIVGASIGFAVRANADPVANYADRNAAVICQVFDKHHEQYPPVEIVVAAVDAITEDGLWHWFDAWRVLGLAVQDQCPRHYAAVVRVARDMATGGAGRVA